MFEPQQILHHHYCLQRRLGSTAVNRQTWLAVDLEQNREAVVVKLLAFHPQMQLEEWKLFQREAQVLQRLEHPYIPAYRDAFSIQAPTLWFALVQDFVPGLSLQDYLDQGQVLTGAEIRELALQVLPILDYLHRQDPPILHRDIKPGHVIWGADDTIYLVDFGAVQNRTPLTGVPFTVVGTCGYAPLEQFWGRAVPASDLYALGATLIHLLTGIPPVDLPQQQGRWQLPPDLSLPPGLAAWLQKMVEPGVEQRFSSALEALEALRANQLPAPATAEARAIAPPDHTPICLTRTPTTLAIDIPPRLLGPRYLFPGLLAAVNLGSLGLVMAIAGAMVLLPFFLQETAWLGPALGSGLLVAWGGWLVWQGWEQTGIRAEGDRLEIRRCSFGRLWEHRIIPRQSIAGVLWQRIDLCNGVSIRTDQEFIQIRQGMTELECVWLVQQIQTWLDRS